MCHVKATTAFLGSTDWEGQLPQKGEWKQRLSGDAQLEQGSDGCEQDKPGLKTFSDGSPYSGEERGHERSTETNSSVFSQWPNVAACHHMLTSHAVPTEESH